MVTKSVSHTTGGGGSSPVSSVFGRVGVVVAGTNDYALNQISGFGSGVVAALSVGIGNAGAPLVQSGSLGTPLSGSLVNATGLPLATGISGFGSGVASALATAAGSAGGPALVNGALGTPSSATLTNATGLPISTGVSGLGSGVAAQLALATDGSSATGSGFRGIPQNVQATNYTLVLADAGKHIYASSGTNIWTIPANASVAYPIGTVVTFINLSSSSATVAITTDTMFFLGAGSTGSRTLAQYGLATATKISATQWVITGPGLT